MNIKLIIALGLIVLVIGGIYFWTNQVKTTIEQNNQSAQLLAGSMSHYYTFTPEAYEQAKEQNKTILLYFYASWCPICKQEQKDAMIPAFNELQNNNLIAFRVHYKDNEATQSEEELAKQFGITYQHTKVIFKDNEIILNDLNSWDKEKYITELKNI